MDPLHISPHSKHQAHFKIGLYLPRVLVTAILRLCLQHLIQLLFLFLSLRLDFTVPKAKCDTNSFIYLFSL